ncbi:SsgA family sporulation/cell division regulator [Streptomyces sp. NPDC002740]
MPDRTAEQSIERVSQPSDARGIAMNYETTHADHEAILLITLRRLAGPAGSDTLLCRLRYDVTDPYAVALDLVVDVTMNISVTWIVARDLLDAGTRELSGEGDFRVWPSDDEGQTEDRLFFRLSRPDGHVTFETSAVEVRRWLDTTQALMPSGAEHRMIDWSAVEAELLSNH